MNIQGNVKYHQQLIVYRETQRIFHFLYIFLHN